MKINRRREVRRVTEPASLALDAHDLAIEPRRGDSRNRLERGAGSPLPTAARAVAPTNQRIRCDAQRFRRDRFADGTLI
jgi:hypothetical protein